MRVPYPKRPGRLSKTRGVLFLGSVATKVETGPATAPAPARTPNWKQKEAESRRTDLERRQADEAGRQKGEYDDAVQRDEVAQVQRHGCAVCPV